MAENLKSLRSNLFEYYNDIIKIVVWTILKLYSNTHRYLPTKWRWDINFKSKSNKQIFNIVVSLKCKIHGLLYTKFSNRSNIKKKLYEISTHLLIFRVFMKILSIFELNKLIKKKFLPMDFQYFRSLLEQLMNNHVIMYYIFKS